MKQETSKLRKYSPTILMTLWMSMIIIGSNIMINTNHYYVSSYMLLIGNLLAFFVIAFFAKIE